MSVFSQILPIALEQLNEQLEQHKQDECRQNIGNGEPFKHISPLLRILCQATQSHYIEKVVKNVDSLILC